MSNTLIEWKRDGYVFTICIDFNELSQRYGVDGACEKFLPMVRTCHRLKDSMFQEQNNVTALDLLVRSIIHENEKRKFEIPVNFISVGREKPYITKWIPRENKNIPLVIDQEFIDENAEILTRVRIIQLSINGMYYNIGFSIEESKCIIKEGIILRYGSQIVSAHLGHIDIEDRKVYKDAQGYSYCFWDNAQDAYTFFESHIENIKAAIFQDHYSVTHNDTTLSKSIERGRKLIQFCTMKGFICVDQNLASSIQPDLATQITMKYKQGEVIIFHLRIILPDIDWSSAFPATFECTEVDKNDDSKSNTESNVSV